VYTGNYGLVDWGGGRSRTGAQVLSATRNTWPRLEAAPGRETIDVQGRAAHRQGRAHDRHAFDGRPASLLSPFGCRARRRRGATDGGRIEDAAEGLDAQKARSSPRAPLPSPDAARECRSSAPEVTAAGRPVNSATLEYDLRAYDTRTGHKLWEARLPAGGQAHPDEGGGVTSRTRPRQYVVVMAGGHGSLGTKMG